MVSSQKKVLKTSLRWAIQATDSTCSGCSANSVATKALRQSALYRADRSSYVLYPDRALPSFLDKNVIPAAVVEDDAVKHAVTRETEPLLADGAVRLTVNRQFCEPFTKLHAGDEIAIVPSSPLPPPPDPSLFERNLVFVFKPE